MRPDDLRLLYEYGYHRNLQLLDKAENLTEEQFSGPASFADWTIQRLFFHIADAERGWRIGWQHNERDPGLEPADYPDIASLRDFFGQTHADTIAFIDTLTEEALDQDFVGIPLWQTMTHVANHGTQHRSEIALLLTNLGHSPGDVDLCFYAFERAGE